MYWYYVYKYYVAVVFCFSQTAELLYFAVAGLIVETVDSGVNGCIVRSVTENEAVARDGRLHVGDFVVRVNDESLRRVTNAQARAILRRSSVLISSITYVVECSFILLVAAIHSPSTAVTENMPVILFL